MPSREIIVEAVRNRYPFAMSRDFVVVMGVIVFGILVLVRMHERASIGAHGKSRATQMLSADLGRSLDAFEQEYGRFPDVGGHDVEISGQTGRRLLGILLGKKQGDGEIQNPRSIAFFNAKASRGRAAGLVYPENDPDKVPEKLCDSWGEPFRVILRREGEASPELIYEGKAVAIPPSPFAIISKGPDRTEGTKDDIRSW